MEPHEYDAIIRHLAATIAKLSDRWIPAAFQRDM